MAAADAEAQSTPLPATFTCMHSCDGTHFRRSATDAILFYSTHHCLTRKPSPSRAEQQGVSCYRANDYDGAIYHFSEALRFNPPDPAQVLGNRAAAFEKIGDFEAAAADFESALQIDPKCRPAQDELGKVKKILAKQAAERVSSLQDLLEAAAATPAAKADKAFGWAVTSQPAAGGAK